MAPRRVTSNLQVARPSGQSWGLVLLDRPGLSTAARPLIETPVFTRLSEPHALAAASCSPAQCVSSLLPPLSSASCRGPRIRSFCSVYSLAHLTQSYGFPYPDLCRYSAAASGCFKKISNLTFATRNFCSCPSQLSHSQSSPSRFLEPPSFHLLRKKNPRSHS